MKIVENEKEDAIISIAKDYLFAELKRPSLHKVARKMEVKSLVYLENKFGKQHLWQELEQGIQQLKVVASKYSKGQNQVYLQAFGEEFPVYYSELNKKLNKYIKKDNLEKQALIIELYQRRLRKSFLYWIMKGNAGK